MMRRISVPLLFLCLMFSCEATPDLQDGDIVFQRLETSQSQALELATGCEYTHMGIVFMNDGRPYVYEAVGPVRSVPLSDWIAQGIDGHVVVKRLKSRNSKIDSAKVQKMLAETKRHLGKSYDWKFNWSDEKMYCSELVWKAYNRGAGIQVGSTKRFTEYNFDHPAVKAKIRERYPNGIPWNETVVAPSDLFDSPDLDIVYEN